ncbi:hypothetical protein QJS66_04135 [Kocuria rhizophila]|nr:hypothetical protein QJS66_04135 [Kocuria rhizophila]
MVAPASTARVKPWRCPGSGWGVVLMFTGASADAFSMSCGCRASSRTPGSPARGRLDAAPTTPSWPCR